MKIKLLLFLFIIFCYSYSVEYSDTITDRDFTIIKVRDGDTFIIDIPNIPDVFGKNIAVRIRGIDTPELNDSREEIRKISIQAKEELERLLLNAKEITLYNLGRDKYFRLLASVKVDNVDVSEYLIKKGLAKKYNGGKKEW
ncbi:thermonuclease family protein [Brachyspira aalborgi]|jgi:endonuclease YncB( thermonuclease family)|uniref:Nuclease n=1 Tax=Brachyspira aalborgi TaxID=29522 RepID=A0ABY3K6L9_9SPIR|nr:thermonuclease family protein [Brachyspira aalborgi]TXJ31141.1 nuclease [Brachyspira aalborgi]TXJ40031.1 nuclease [Brachyspira aalborgi]DAZ18839.1 MAG TPA: nuclease-like protein [Caudoviricetes sp.]